MILREMIQRAVDIASARQPTTIDRLAIEAAAEPMLSIVFNIVSERTAGDEYRRHLLKRTSVIAFVNGSGTIPETVLTHYLNESVLYDTAAPSSIYSHVPEWSDFVRHYDTRLGAYTVNESTASVIQPAATYVIGSGLTGNLSLVTPCTIAVPTVITNPIVARDEIIDDLTAELAARLVVA